MKSATRARGDFYDWRMFGPLEELRFKKYFAVDIILIL